MALHQRAAEADFAARARYEAERMALSMSRAKPSGLLGDSRMADIGEAEAANLFDPNGLFLGALNKRLLFFDGEGPLLTYLRTRGGKGRDLLLPNLAHVRNRSLLTIDIKDGENWYASSDHREENLGIPSIILNPFGVRGVRGVRINPLQSLVSITSRGGALDTEATEIAQILLPLSPKEGESAWVKKGAIRYLATYMEYLAHFDPECCNLTGLWRFVNANADQMDTAFAMMATCGIEAIERKAGALDQTRKNAAKQFEAYKADAQEALEPYEAGKSLGNATLAHEFDFARLKHKPHSVYLVLPSDKLGVAASWISLILNHAIETIAKEVGPVRTTFLLDEFPQLPPAPAIMKTLRLYQGKGIQLWFFAQGRFSMEDRWSRDAVKEIEDQAAVTTYKGVREPSLIKDIELWSGNETVLMRGVSRSGGVVETAAANLGEARRTVLQSENIVGLAADEQILKLSVMPRLLISKSVSFFDVDPWKHQIKDVRKLHFGEGNQ